MDAKRFLRLSWIWNLSFALVVSAILACTKWAGNWLAMLPFLFGGIALEAAAAAGGSSLKRITEATLVKAEKGKK